MKTGSRQFDCKTQVCSMCGAAVDDFWETNPRRLVVLRHTPRPGDVTHICVLCDECEEGIRGLNLSQKPAAARRSPERFLSHTGGPLKPKMIRHGCRRFWSSRPVRLTIGHIIDKSKGGDDSPQNLRAICDRCNEGLQNTSPMKPDQIQLLSQIRRATLDDQKAVLNWLIRKFGVAIPTPGSEQENSK